MNRILLEQVNDNMQSQRDQPVLLYRDEDHAIYWLGIPEDTAFRSNTYLVMDSTEAVLVGSGGRSHFPYIRDRVMKVLSSGQVNAMILSSQDPDVAGSMSSWLKENPDIQVLTSFMTNMLINHYGEGEYTFHNIDEEPSYSFQSGRKLRFISSPFLPYPGAFTTWDETSRFLFSGDIWSAIDMDWKLIVEDFDAHKLKMDMFHSGFMASSAACRGFLERLHGLDISAILPFHGSAIPGALTPAAMQYLKGLKCGIDLLYPRYIRGY